MHGMYVLPLFGGGGSKRESEAWVKGTGSSGEPSDMSRYGKPWSLYRPLAGTPEALFHSPFNQSKGPMLTAKAPLDKRRPGCTGPRLGYSETIVV